MKAAHVPPTTRAMDDARRYQKRIRRAMLKHAAARTRMRKR